MSQSASPREDDLISGPAARSEKVRALPANASCAPNGDPAGRRKIPIPMNAPSQQETPLGAIHVDASGVVLEHRPLEGSEPPVEATSIVGWQMASIAAWASEPAFVSALKSALSSAKVSFHFDFRVAASSRERMIHVNILAVGDTTAWIFIVDKTLVS